MTFLTVLFLMYWLPTIVAIVRRTPSALGVAMLNFFLGWTVIGWIIALVIALAAYPAERVVVIEGRARY
jgi:Superinfection immunity protein